MLVPRLGHRHRAGRAHLTNCYTRRCSEERMVRDARGETGPPAKSRARATYLIVSVTLLPRL